MYGHGSRAVQFLLTLLAPLTQQRYQSGLDSVNEWARQRCIDFWALDVEAQDFVLSDYSLDLLEDGISPQFCTDSVAAVSKQYLNHRVYRGAARVIIGWKSTLPVNEAQPMPEAGAYAIATLAALTGDYDIAFVVVVGFCALLRIDVLVRLC